MTTTIDKKVVEMGFDNSEFEKGVDKTLKDVDKLKKGLAFEDSTRSFSNLTSSMNSQNNFAGITGAVENISSRFSILGVIGFTAIQNITNSVIDLTKKLWNMVSPIENAKKGLGEYETQINAVQTIMANTSSKGTTLTQVNEALDQLNTYADKTIYNFSEMTRNIGTFTAAGIDLDTSVAAIKGIANLAAVSGSNSQQASTAMYQLSQALSSGTLKLMDWNSVVNAGMGGQVFQDALKETARAHGVAVDDIIKKEGSFRESLTTGWITSSILTETLSKFTGDLNAEQLKTMGYTEDQIAAILKMGQVANDAATKVKTFSQLKETLAEAVGSGWAQSWRIVVGDFEEAKALFTTISDTLGGLIGESADSRNSILQTWKDVGGRAAIVKGIQFAFEALVAVLKPIKEAFAAIFPPSTGGQLLYLSLLVTEFARKLKLSSTGALKVKIIFRGLFAVFDIIRMAIVAVIKVFSKFTGVLGPASGGLIDLLLTFSSYIIRLREGIIATDAFGKAIERFGSFIKLAIGAISNFISWIKLEFDKIKPYLLTVGGYFTTFLDGVKEKFQFIKDWLPNMFSGIDTSGVDSFFEKVGTRFEPLKKIGQLTALVIGGIVKLVAKLAPTFFNIASDVAGALAKFVQAIGQGISELDFTKLYDAINAGLLTGMLLAIKSFIGKGGKAIDSMGGVFDSLKGIFSGVSGVLDGVRGSLEAYQQNLKAKTLLTIALAIGVLAASLLVLSLIDSKKLTSALLAITTLFAELSISMSIFSAGGGAGVKATTSLVAMAVAIGILALALLAISKIDQEDISKGIVAILQLTTTLVLFGKLLSQQSGSMLKSAVGLIAFSLGLSILVSVVRRLGEIDPEKLTTGLKGVGILLAELAIFMQVSNLGGKSGFSSGASILALSGAILVLSLAVSRFSEMDSEKLQQGLLAVGIVLAEIAAFTQLTGDGKRIIATSIGVTILAAAMMIFAEVIAKLGELSLEEIQRGLAAMGLSLLIVVAAIQAMPKNALLTGVALVVIAGALVILSKALSSLGDMSWDEIARGLAAMAGALTILAIAMQVMQSSILGAGAILIAAGALAILAPVLKTLGGMSLSEIGIALIALAGAFLVLGIAGALITPVVPTLLGLGIAIALIGVGIGLVGLGILAFSTALAALAVSGAAGAAAIVIIVTTLIGLVPMLIKAVVEGLMLFVQLVGDSAPIVAEAFTKVLLAIISVIATVSPPLIAALLQLLLDLINLIVTAGPPFIEAVLTLVGELLATLAEKVPDFVQSGMDILLGFLKGIRDNIFEIVTVGIEIVTEFIDAVASKLPDIIDSGFNLIVKFIEGLATAIDENGDELRTAIGKLASAIIDGLADGLKSGVGAVAKAIGSLASAAISALKLLLGIHSPSTVFTEFGELTALGFVNGLVKMAGDVEEAAIKIGTSAMNGMTESINMISDFLLDSPEFTPVITPVVDLTNVVAGRESVSDIFNEAIGVSGIPRTLSSISSGTSPILPQDSVKNGEGNSVITFTQNNYSPVPLSRFEIYRQTRNQLALVKQAIK